ncbi:ROK family glucokinase [Alteribacter natronophilus]|uniref:ROK family glucokinase n=1 Tax=Alteribacter natronophilus TaxID=2583810 RepID=UPI00110EDD45|nr:ROK family glucokinase [Alteribacter natronophilus]TMW73795.1 ROK family glucokinase [Alteribacter natronophilus]
MNRQTWLAGVDVGGTTIKLAILTEEGSFIEKWEIPTNTAENGHYIPGDIAAALKDRLASHQEEFSVLKGIGVGAPGFIEADTGFVYQAVNIGWQNYPLSERLGRETGVPVYANNDANLAAAGEMWKGAGKGAPNMLAVTLGTGVGGGLIAEGRILQGAYGMAGEIGHITSIPSGGSPCNCGKTGCLETVSSATGIVRLAMEKVHHGESEGLKALFDDTGTLSAKDVFDEAEKGDAGAEAVVEEAMYHLGLAVGNLANSLNPNVIVIGGGVSRAGEKLLRVLRRHFDRFALPKIAAETTFEIAELGNDAGVLGAAWLAREKTGRYSS